MAKFKRIGGIDTLRKIYHFFPMFFGNFVDATFKGDVTIWGVLNNQGSTATFKGIAQKSSNSVPFFVINDTNIKQDLVLSQRASTPTQEFNKIPRYPKAYAYWNKNSDTGQFQPSITGELPHVLNPDFDPTDPTNPDKGYQYRNFVVVAAQGTLKVLNWYLRSPTGFKNYYVRMYKGVVLNPKGNDHLIVWQSHDDKDIYTSNCFTHSADVVNDIQFPLNDDYYQTNGQLYTFWSFNQEPLTLKSGMLEVAPSVFIPYPYVIADGYDVYNMPATCTVQRTGSLLNFDGVQSMLEDLVFGYSTHIDSGDYNCVRVFLDTNGMNTVGKSCQLRVGVYDHASGVLLAQGALLIDNSVSSHVIITIPFTTIMTINDATKVVFAFVSNDHSSTGVVRVGRLRSISHANTDIAYEGAWLTGGALPTNKSAFAPLSVNTDVIISELAFDINLVKSELALENQPFMKGYSI